jgi:hypothetical protein
LFQHRLPPMVTFPSYGALSGQQVIDRRARQ